VIGDNFILAKCEPRCDNRWHVSNLDWLAIPSFRLEHIWCAPNPAPPSVSKNIIQTKSLYLKTFLKRKIIFTSTAEFQPQPRDRCCQCKKTFQILRCNHLSTWCSEIGLDLTQKTCSSLMVGEGKNLQISNGLESLEVSRVDGSSIYKLVPKNSIS